MQNYVNKHPWRPCILFIKLELPSTSDGAVIITQHLGLLLCGFGIGHI